MSRLSFPGEHDQAGIREQLVAILGEDVVVQVERDGETYSLTVIVPDESDARAQEIVETHDSEGSLRAAALAAVRARRNLELAASDWTMLPDVAVADAQRRKWTTYRQTLRDLPAQKGPEFVWPERP